VCCCHLDPVQLVESKYPGVGLGHPEAAKVALERVDSPLAGVLGALGRPLGADWARRQAEASARCQGAAWAKRQAEVRVTTQGQVKGIDLVKAMGCRVELAS